MMQSHTSCQPTYCPVAGSTPWNFSAPSLYPQSAFAAHVLKTLPHPCDRDYEHGEGLVSCAPLLTYLLTDNENNPQTTTPTTRTRTYRRQGADSVVDVVKHTTANTAAGFLGTNLTYWQLGYSSTTTSQASAPRPIPCVDLGLCTLQSDYKAWFVNGVMQGVRWVTPPSSPTRPYAKQDMMECGSMGMLVSPTTCLLDVAVNPLFFIHCTSCGSAQVCGTFCVGGLGQYQSGLTGPQLGALASTLNTLFSLLAPYPLPKTWQDYLGAVDLATGYWKAITSLPNVPLYGTSRPTGLYYLLSYGAYEVPFSWWFRCGWLMGVGVSTAPSACPTWGVQPTTPLPLLQWLSTLEEGFNSTMVDNARNLAHKNYIQLINSTSIPPITFGCHQQASVRQDLLNSHNNEYGMALLTNQGRPWSQSVVDANGGVICAGGVDCLDHGQSTPSPLRNMVKDMVNALLSTPKPCTSSCFCTTNLAPNTCAWMQDTPPTTVPPTSTTLGLFKPEGFQMTGATFADLAALYSTREDGCVQYPSCPTSPCQCVFKAIQPTEAQSLGISSPSPSTPPWIIVSNSFTAPPLPTLSQDGYGGGDGWFGMDLCSASNPSTRCNLLVQPPSDICVASNDVAKLVEAQYCPPSATLYTSTNPQSSQCLSRDCFKNFTLGNKVLHLPPLPALKVTAYVAAPVPCYRLSCPLNHVLVPTPLSLQLNATYYELAAQLAELQYYLEIPASDPQYTTDELQRLDSLKIAVNYDSSSLYPDPASRAKALAQDQATLNAFQANITYYPILLAQVAAAHSATLANPPIPVAFGAPSMDGKVVLDPTPYTDSQYTVTTLQVIQYTYLSGIKLGKIANLSINGVTKLVEAWPECGGEGCTMNSLHTRSLSVDYALSKSSSHVFINAHDPNTLEYYGGVVQSMVANTEDHYVTDSQNGHACMQLKPEELTACNYTNPTGSNGIQEVYDCPADILSATCATIGSTLCAGKSKNPSCTVGDGIANFFESLVGSQYGCDGGSDYDACMQMFSDVNTCVADLSLVCTVIVYERTEITSACTTTPLKCPYDQMTTGQSWESVYTNYGLPRAGFCPTCGDNTCPADKASSTYGVARANIPGMHSFVGVQVSDGDVLPTNTEYLEVQLGGMTSAPTSTAQCSASEISCAALQRPVEVLGKVWACADCIAAPLVQCVGPHACGFQPWGNLTNISGFPAAFAAVQGAVEAQLAAHVGNVTPFAFPWLNPQGFTGFDPTTLDEGFNTMIEDLHGECNVAQTLPDFSTCQNDLPRTTLRSHVQTHYKVAEGIQIPSGSTLSWPVGYTQYTTTLVPAWESTAPPSPSFLQSLFNDTLCAQASFSELVCMETKGSLTFFNPSSAGNFEVQEGCDAVLIDSNTRVIDSQCNNLACPLNSLTSDYYNMFQGSDPTTNWMSCKTEDHQIPAYYTTPASYSSNLCSKRPTVPQQCTRSQGMLGGEGSAVSDLYTSYPSLSSTNISLDPYAVGDQYIRMAVATTMTRGAGSPLRSYGSLQTARSLNATTWHKQYTTLLPEETNSLTPTYPDPQCGTWACPFKRRWFWSGEGEKFRPSSPDPSRAKIFYNTPTSPTTSPALLKDGVLKGYKSLNGLCLGDTTPSSGNCSLLDTQNSLSDGKQRVAMVLGASCTSQVDWPYTGGMMRDSSFLQPTSAPPCGTLDRLPAFKYRYWNSRTTLPSPTTTLDEGGVCHSSRVGQSTAPIPTDCTLVSKNTSWLVVRCGGVDVPLARPQSPSVQTLLSTTTRTRCQGGGEGNTCTPTPTFQSSTGTPVPPESSFGQLWRIAPARLLARDLRFRLCGNGTSCPPSSSWTLETFWQQMMAGTLLTPNPTNPTLDSMFSSTPPDPPNATWDSPWMLCTKNSSGEFCSGSISKNQWLGGNKTAQCLGVLSQPNAPSAAVGVSICELDAAMDQLCTLIQTSRYQIFEANCQLAGNCSTSAFFYQPATYSTDDSEFVRDTVGYFYNFTEPGSCPVQDQETMKILAQNQATAQYCAATDLQALQDAIQLARDVLHFFVKMAYYAALIGFDIIQLVTTTDTGPVIQQITYYFNQMAAEFLYFFQTLGDVVYKMVMETGKLGQFLKNLILQVCNFLSATFVGAVKPFVCAIRDAVLAVMDAFQTAISALSTILGGALDGFDSSVKASRDKMATTFDCDLANPFNCAQLFPADPALPASLPMPTRCWTGYQPSLGDQSNLGCTAADTCINPDNGDSLGACAACQGGTSMTQYGCDPLTKLCRCNSLPVSSSSCSSNQDCALDGVGCTFVDRYLQPAYGAVPCTSCTTQPICLMGTGSSGTCSCEMVKVTTLSCTAVGQRVMPDPTAACLVSLGLGVSSSAQYTADYTALALAPCSSINSAQAYCLTVYLTASTSAPMVVGLALLGSRRRLMARESTPLHPAVNLSKWRDTPEPCRSLMLEGGGGGVMDRVTREECERWEQVGAVARGVFNLTAVPSTAFSSWQGLGEVMLQDPTAATQVAKSGVRLGVFLLVHSQSIAPALAVLRHVMGLLRPAANITWEYWNSKVMTSTPRVAIRQVPELLPWFVRNDTRRNVTRGNFTTTNNITTPLLTTSPTPLLTHNHSRRLFQTSWKDNLPAVQTFSISIASGEAATLPVDIQNQWMQGPFTWPPNYNYWNTDNPCLLAQVAFNFTLLTFQATSQYYTGDYMKPSVSRTFTSCLPQLPPTTTLPSSPALNNHTLYTGMFSWVGGGSIASYVQDPTGNGSLFFHDIHSLLTCDFLTVQHCSGFTRDLGWSSVVVGVGWVVVAVVGRQLGVPFIEVGLLATYLPVVWMWAFGVSPLCAPMIPTCALQEIQSIVEAILPPSIAIPSQLQRWPGCVDGALPLLSSGAVDSALLSTATPKSPSCLRPCGGWPFSFNTWQDTIAWMVVDWGWEGISPTLQSFQPWIALLPPPLSDFFSLDTLASAISTKLPYAGWADMASAQRVCWILTAYNILPLVVGVGVVGVVLLAGTALPFLAVQYVVSVGLSLLQFIHTR